MENPEPLAGLHIEAANIASDISAALRIAAGEMRRADDHHVLGDERRGMQADLAGHEVDLLIVVELEIDHAAFAEAGNGLAGLGVQRDQPVARRDIENPLFLAVGPISHAMAGKLPRRVGAAHPFIFAMDPEKFAGSGIQGHH